MPQPKFKSGYLEPCAELSDDFKMELFGEMFETIFEMYSKLAIKTLEIPARFWEGD